jgi:hypothetical protein
LREHLLDLFITQNDLVDWVSLSLKGFEIAFNIRGKEDLCEEVRFEPLWKVELGSKYLDSTRSLEMTEHR